MNSIKKVLFVNPPLHVRQRYGPLSQAGAIEPPLGLIYMAAVTKQMGIDTSILDASALQFDIHKTVDKIFEKRPDIVCLTAATPAINCASLIASQLKKRQPDIVTVIGGFHLSALPEDTMKNCAGFDIGVIGEGEQTVKELIEALRRGNSLTDVDGLIFRQNGKLYTTTQRGLIKHLDALGMPEFGLLPNPKQFYRVTTQSIKYLPTISLVTSRGCMGQCTFCDNIIFGRKVRVHSAEFIAHIMEKLYVDFGIRGLSFEDDNFLTSTYRLEKLSLLLNKRKINMAWSAMTRIDTITERKIRLAKNCGCWQVLFGIESGSQKILDFYKKNINIEQIHNAVHIAKRCGLYTKGFFIWGNPLETTQTIKETQRLIFQLPLDDISLTYFTPYPGAQIWNDVDKYGQCDKDWDRLTCFDMVFTPNGMDPAYIKSTFAQTLKEFYSQPKIWRSYLSRIRSFPQVKEFYRSWRSLLSLTQIPQYEKKLIINADDFGLSKHINDGIQELLSQKRLGAVSIMPTGPVFDEAVNIVKRNPTADVGVHLSLTRGRPVLPNHEISSLINKKTGYFIENLFLFVISYLFGRIEKSEIKNEFYAQIDEVRNKGLTITHLNSERHIHLLPGIFKIVLELADELGIRFIRLPLAPLNRNFFIKKTAWSRKLLQVILNIFCIINRKSIKKYSLLSCYRCLGFEESGHLTDENLKMLLNNLSEGKTELICHPGKVKGKIPKSIKNWSYDWNGEFYALSSERLMGEMKRSGVIISRFT